MLAPTPNRLVASSTTLKFNADNPLGKDDPREIGKALSGDYSGLWRYRVGDYRIVCELKDKVFRVLVVRVGHRKDIYD